MYKDRGHFEICEYSRYFTYIQAKHVLQPVLHIRVKYSDSIFNTFCIAITTSNIPAAL